MVGLQRANLPVGVAELVVIPGDQLHERWRQLDAGLGVHNGGPEIRIEDLSWKGAGAFHSAGQSKEG